MIVVKKSNKADTRTCDVEKVTRKEFDDDIQSHIGDVERGMLFFARQVELAGYNHDYTKITEGDSFYLDFKTKFKNEEWYKMHQKEERHHFNNEEYIQNDINLIDVLEQITDCVMAGMARSGKFRKEDLPDGLLKKAYDNTVDLLLSKIKVVEGGEINETKE